MRLSSVLAVAFTASFNEAVSCASSWVDPCLNVWLKEREGRATVANLLQHPTFRGSAYELLEVTKAEGARIPSGAEPETQPRPVLKTARDYAFAKVRELEPSFEELNTPRERLGRRLHHWLVQITAQQYNAVHDMADALLDIPAYEQQGFQIDSAAAFESATRLAERLLTLQATLEAGLTSAAWRAALVHFLEACSVPLVHSSTV